MNQPIDAVLGSPEDLADRAERARRRQQELADWLDGRSGAAPHLYKERVIRDYARRSGARTLIETGTYVGEMIDAQLNAGLFDRIVSIELSEDLAARAVKRYADHPQVEIVQGDSGSKLAEVISTIRGKAVFWLDGHYSMGFTARGETDTPILSELEHVLALRGAGHTILIDDARSFVEEPSYPSIAAVREKVITAWPNADFTLAEDVMRITEPAAAS